MTGLTPSQVKALNRKYCREERKRTLKLEKAFRAYTAKAKELGFHPLDLNEIEDRLRELNAMEARSEDPEYVARQVQLSKWQSEATA